jgi:hypothetical protein
MNNQKGGTINYRLKDILKGDNRVLQICKDCIPTYNITGIIRRLFSNYAKIDHLYLSDSLLHTIGLEFFSEGI